MNGTSCVRHESVNSHEMQRSLDVTLCPTYVCHLQSTKLQNSIDDTGKEVIGDALHGLDKYAQQKQQDDSQHQKKTDETLNKIAKVRTLGLHLLHFYSWLSCFCPDMLTPRTTPVASNRTAAALQHGVVSTEVLQDTQLSIWLRSQLRIKR